MAPTGRKGNSRKMRNNRPTTRGKSDVKKAFSKVEKSLGALTQKIESLEVRLQRAEVAAGVDVSEFVWNSYPQSQRKKPGIAPAYRLYEWLARRDAAVTFLEMNWPEIKRALQRARKPQDLEEALRSAQKPTAALVEPEFVQNPAEFLDEFWEFTKSKRYCNNPRWLADAMAGLPKSSWKRSFDVCGRSKCTLTIHARAIRDFLQRKFPQRLRELTRARTDATVLSILQRSRTKDRHYLALLQDPNGVLESLRIGRPGILS
jgi:hypothetical protein